MDDAATAEPPGQPAAGPLERLFAGGLHVRFLMMGRPPPGLVLPPHRDFERFVRVLPRAETMGDTGVGAVVAEALRLPFVEALFDKALAATLLPAETARAELRELWRVLAPAGLAVLVVKARRRWQLAAPGWTREALAPVVEDAMFETLDWRVVTVPDRHHLLLVGKRDGLRPALVGRVAAAELAPAG